MRASQISRRRLAVRPSDRSIEIIGAQFIGAEGFSGPAASLIMATSSRTEKELPLELVEEILLRIPVKPLHRFLCVSKPWYSLISCPSFHVHHYRRQSLQNPLFLLIENEHDKDRGITHLRLSTCSYQGDLLNQFSKTVPITNQLPTLSFQPIQSCFGLVCLQSFRRPILVCNPSTQQLIALPLPTTEGSKACFGFGYAPSTQEFKVVRFFHREIDDVDCCEIFTLGTTEGWREATTPPPFQLRPYAPLVHGALHLMPMVDKTRVDRYIVAFDIDAEECREIPLPDIYSSKARPLNTSDIDIKEFRGSLYLVLYETEKQLLEFWFLKDYNNPKWVKEYNIDVSAVCDVRPQAIMGDGRILFREDDELAYYNTQEKCLGESFLKQKIRGNWSVMLYLESFFHLGRLEQIGSSAAPLADLLLNPSDGTAQKRWLQVFN